MGYIKPAKIWYKKFDKKFVEEIFDMFKDVADAWYVQWNGERIAWREVKYKNVFIVGSQNEPVPPHPETDRFDDTEGITPGQFKKILENFDNDMKVVAEYLKSIYFEFKQFRMVYGKEEYEIIERLDNGKFSFSWKNYFKKYVKGKFSEHYAAIVFLEEFFSSLKGASLFLDVIHPRNTNFFTPKYIISEIGVIETDPEEFYVLLGSMREQNKNYKIDQSFLCRMLSSKEIFKTVQSNVLIGSYENGTIISEKNYDQEKTLNKIKEKWDQLHGFVPKNRNVLMIDPEIFSSQSFVSALSSIFGVKQLSRLDEDDQVLFCKIYSIFGFMTPHISGILSRDMKTKNFKKNISSWSAIKPNFSREKFENAVQRGLRISARGIDYFMNNIERIYFFTKGMSIAESIVDLFEKKDRPTVRDMDSLIEFGKISAWIASVIPKESVEIIANLKEEDFRYIQKNEMVKSHLKELLSLYEKTKDTKLDGIPLVSGECEGFSYQMLQKSDFIGLIVGNITGCCQRIGGVGESCVRKGAEREYSTFFVVRNEKGDIVAQSYVWRIEDQLTFDSIEVIYEFSREFGEEIMACYEDAAKAILREEEKIKFVTMGHNNCYTERSYREHKNPLKIDTYTDASYQYILAEK